MGAEEGEEGAVSVLKRERLCDEGGEEEESPNKKQAKEPSNDDIVSEISNPVSSPVENTSRFHPVKSGSGDFGSEETVSDEERSGNEQFVLEIPKHLSSTGVTRITFKLSKQKKEFDDTPVVKDHAWDEKKSPKLPKFPKLPKKKDVASTSYPSNVKKLLATGMLDGAPVKYISLPRVVKSQPLSYF